MIRSKFLNRAAMAGALAGLLLIPAGEASAQGRGEPGKSLRQSAVELTLAQAATSPSPTTRAAVQAPAGRQRSRTRKIFGGLFGATAGFFAGGYLGAKVEGGDCHCDDPGLKGVIIGAPIGAAVGGILGALLF